MHILLDASIVRSPFSGVHYAVRQEVEALAKQKEENHYTVLGRDAFLQKVAERSENRYACTPLICKRRSFRIFWQQLILPFKLKNSTIDMLFALGYTAPLMLRKPYVLQVHDIIALEHPEYCSTFNALHMRALLEKSIRHASGIITSSQHVASNIRKRFHLSDEKVEAIPLGVNFKHYSTPSKFNPELKEKLTTEPYLLFVGNLEPKKGLDVLLDAYPAIARNTSLNLVIAGRKGWKYESILRRIKNYDGPGRIIVTGRVKSMDLRALYQHAYAFVFPSYTEGFGLPVLESMAAGVPVIHSSHPVLQETAGNAGLQFAVGDCMSLYKAVLYMYEHADVHTKCIKEGRLHARRFTWKKWAMQSLDFISKTARNGTGKE